MTGRAFPSHGPAVSVASGAPVVSMVDTDELARLRRAERFRADTNASASIHPNGFPEVHVVRPKAPDAVPFLVVDAVASMAVRQFVDSVCVSTMHVTGRAPTHYSIAQARALRDALDAAIAEAEAVDSPESETEMARRRVG